MPKKFFPRLDESNMKVVATLYEEDPNYFNTEDCPYSDITIGIFTAGSAANDFFDSDEEMDISEFDPNRLMSEINGLWTQLKQQGTKMKESTSGAERNTYFRMTISLLDKVITLRERCMNLKKMQEFTDYVLSIMQDHMDAEQRTAVMKKLEKILEEE